MDNRKFKESLKFKEVSNKPLTDEYLSQMSEYTNEKLNEDLYNIVKYLRKFEKEIEEEDENSKNKQQDDEKIKPTSVSMDYFYSLSFETSHLKNENNKSIENSLKAVCEKYKINFKEITTILKELRELQGSETTEEIRDYIQKLDDKALQYFEEKDKTKQKE